MDGTTGRLKMISNSNGPMLKVDQNFLWYNASAGNNKISKQASGAYIFRYSKNHLQSVGILSDQLRRMTKNCYQILEFCGKYAKQIRRVTCKDTQSKCRKLGMSLWSEKMHQVLTFRTVLNLKMKLKCQKKDTAP